MINKREPHEFSVEQININSEQVIHVSLGGNALSEIQSRAGIFRQAEDFFNDAVEGDIPVLVDVEIIHQMGPVQRMKYFRKFCDEIVLGHVKQAGVELLSRDELMQFFKDSDLEVNVSKISGNADKYNQLDADNRVVIIAADMPSDIPNIKGVSILPVLSGLDEDIHVDHIMDIAAYIAQTGRRFLLEGADSKANRMLRELLIELYKNGDIPEGLATPENATFADLLENPETLLIPPVSTADMTDIESYIRAVKAVEAMA